MRDGCGWEESPNDEMETGNIRYKGWGGVMKKINIYLLINIIFLLPILQGQIPEYMYQ